jgi:hypothetical protein
MGVGWGKNIENYAKKRKEISNQLFFVYNKIRTKDDKFNIEKSINIFKITRQKHIFKKSRINSITFPLKINKSHPKTSHSATQFIAKHTFQFAYHHIGSIAETKK